MNAPSPASTWRARPGFLVALLLAWFFGQTISVSPELGFTADETSHIAAGFSYWRTGDYRLQPENGNLPQRLESLPTLWLRPAWVAADNYYWRHADVWGVSQSFFFHDGNLPDLMLFGGRIMNALVGVATGLLVFLAARSVFGVAGGLLATAVFAVNPGLLAQAGLATSDMMAAFGFLAASLSGWHFLHRVTPGRVAAFGTALGVLALAKFSAPLFGFVFAVLVLVRLGRRAPLAVQFGAWRRQFRGWRRAGMLALATAAAAGVAYGMIWAAYGFRYATTPTGSEGETRLLVSWDLLLGRVPSYLSTPTPPDLPRTDLVPVQRNAVRASAEWIKNHRALPEAYVYGFLHVYTYSRWRPAFFMGEYKVVGWPTYFPTAFLVKNPLALLALYLLAAVALVRRSIFAAAARCRRYRLTPLLALGGIYAAFALTTRLNIGYRHLLPIDVVLCACTGGLALLLPPHLHWRWGLVGALVLATNVAGWSARPGYLAFFNLLPGGPTHAYEFFVDSSLDWGQGLPRLRAWLDRQHRGEPVYLAYFGSDSPAYAGLRITRISDQFLDRDPRRPVRDLSPGLYVVSATLFQGIYTYTPGPWNSDYERIYRVLRQRARAVAATTLPASFWLEWDQVRFGRLRHFLHTRPPDAQPDPSLLVFRLTAADLAAALDPDAPAHGVSAPPIKPE